MSAKRAINKPNLSNMTAQHRLEVLRGRLVRDRKILYDIPAATPIGVDTALVDAAMGMYKELERTLIRIQWGIEDAD